MKTIEVFNTFGLKNEEIVIVVRGEELARSTTELDNDFEITMDGNIVGRGKAISSWAGPLQALPAYLLEKHHDPACRSFSSLVLVLSMVAGEQVQGRDLVSVLHLQPTASSLKIANHVPTGLRPV